jgi:WhiB family transcriptional regulator, redox-sensing transcriptional regulator
MTARQRRAVRGAPPWGGAPGPLETLTDALKPLKWQNRAACRDVGGDAWYPEDHHNVSRTVRTVCDSCPVRDECLEDALARDDQHGVWGGYSVRERRQIRADREGAAA